MIQLDVRRPSHYDQEAERSRILSIQPRLKQISPTGIHLYLLVEDQIGEIPEFDPSHFKGEDFESIEGFFKDEQPLLHARTFVWETDVFWLYYYIRTALDGS